MKRSDLNSVALDKFIRNGFAQFFTGHEGRNPWMGEVRTEYKDEFCNPGLLNTILEFRCHVHRY